MFCSQKPCKNKAFIWNNQIKTLQLSEQEAFSVAFIQDSRRSIINY